MPRFVAIPDGTGRRKVFYLVPSIPSSGNGSQKKKRKKPLNKTASDPPPEEKRANNGSKKDREKTSVPSSGMYCPHCNEVVGNGDPDRENIYGESGKEIGRKHNPCRRRLAVA